MEVSTSDQLRSSAHKSHLDLLSRGILSDVTFIVGPGKERIPCHQLFLIARSPVFAAMFSERWNQKEVPLEDTNPEIFKKFLQFIYADTFVANVPEALELLQVAHTYDVQLLVSKCEELLENEMTLNDAVDVYQAGKKYDKIKLIEKAAAIMAKSLDEFKNLPSFSRLDKEALVYILKSDWICMPEVNLFGLAVKWAHNQSDLTTEQILEDILPLIRFPLMTLEEFTTTVVPTGLLSLSTLVEVFTYFGSNAETKKSLASTLKFNTQRRRFIHFVDLYSGDFATKPTKRLQLGQLRDSLQISVRITGTKGMGIYGISFYCPARAVSTGSSPAGSNFKEFKIVGSASMPHVKAEEGKITEIKFDKVVRLEQLFSANYYITVEEILPKSTQLGAGREDYYDVKVFDRLRNCELILKMTEGSLITESTRNIEAQKSLGDSYEHPQLICRLYLEEL